MASRNNKRQKLLEPKVSHPVEGDIKEFSYVHNLTGDIRPTITREQVQLKVLNSKSQRRFRYIHNLSSNNEQHIDWEKQNAPGKMTHDLVHGKVETICNPNDAVPLAMANVPTNDPEISSPANKGGEVEFVGRTQLTPTRVREMIEGTRRKRQRPHWSLEQNETDSILNGAWLGSVHISKFLALITNDFPFRPMGPQYVRTPDRILPISLTGSHLEILHSGTKGSLVDGASDGHWVCLYYKDKCFNIYDSLNRKSLHPDHRIYLDHLIPNWESLEVRTNFPWVQQQPNFDDCGVFAIAFCTTVLLGGDPEKIAFDVRKMRPHLCHMLTVNRIDRFPIDIELSRRAEMRARIIANNQVRYPSPSGNPASSASSEAASFTLREAGDSLKQPGTGPTRKSENSLMKEKRYYDRNREMILQKKRKRYADNKMELARKKPKLELPKTNKISLGTMAAKKILRKYRKIHHRLNIVNLLKEKEKYIVDVVQRLDYLPFPEARMFAEDIVNIVIYERQAILRNMSSKFKLCKTLLGKCLFQLSENHKRDTLNDVKPTVRHLYQYLCGMSKHNASTENYLAVGVYKWIESNALYECETQTSVGTAKQRAEVAQGSVPKSVESLQHKKKEWQCRPHCNLDDIDSFNELKAIFQELEACQLNRLVDILEEINQCSRPNADSKVYQGHPISCHENPLLCTSKILKLRVIRPHFPTVRTIMNYIYAIIRKGKELKGIHEALNSVDVVSLIDIYEKSNIRRKQREAKNIDLNEASIREKYKLAFAAYIKKCIELPTIPCISCEKLCPPGKVKKLDEKIMNIRTDTWIQVMNAYTPNTGDGDYVCNQCLVHHRQNKMPTNCFLNGLYALPIPAEIEALNKYEATLISRAKAFQVIKKKGTVMQKALPNACKIDAVVGRTFHLPLPIEQTLKKICPPTDPLNTDHEMYILVRSLPNAARVVWENLVDLKRVWKALDWLKKNNPLYKDIILPSFENRDRLLDGLKPIAFEDCATDPAEGESDHQMKRNSQIVDEPEPAAMLTSKTPSDPFYDEYTVYPMHNRSKNEDSTKLYQTLKIYESPLGFNVKNLDVQCFPQVYPHGTHGQQHERPYHLRDADYIKSRLLSKHPRFRSDVQYIFHLLDDDTRRRLNAGIFQTMNVASVQNPMTAGEFLAKLPEKQLENHLNTVFSRLPNTEQYWKKPRMDLQCMVDHYGPPHIFLTISPGEWMWSDLGEYIRKHCAPKHNGKSISELIVLEPVLTSIFLENRFQAILEFILSPDAPVGKVVHYLWRKEYQGRGVEHWHLVLWIEDGPILDKSPVDVIRDFILSYMTCRIPDPNISPDLHRKVNAYQRHKCNTYCARKKTTKTGCKTVCRFGFPRPQETDLVVKDLAMSIAGRMKLRNNSRLYNLPRTQKEAFINDYNPPIQCVWEGNTDIQAIGDSCERICQYVMKYVTKPESSNLDLNSIRLSKDLRSSLWSYSLRALTNRECGALEAADLLLGYQLYGFDKETMIRWVDVRINRNRRLKPHAQIQKLEGESTEIFCPNLIDSYYPNRPDELESLCLYEFAKHYDIIKTEPKRRAEYYPMKSPGLFCRKRKKNPYIINHYKNNPVTDSENYYAALLLLFKPWRGSSTDLKLTSETYVEAFDKIRDSLPAATLYHKKYTELLDAQGRLQKDVECALEKDTAPERNLSEPLPDGCVLPGVDTVMEDFNKFADKVELAGNLTQNISMLNKDQSRIFNKIKDSLAAGNRIRTFISGFGGTGKSLLIRTIVQYNKITRDKNTITLGPTGLSALNVNGQTIHKLLQLPVQHGGTADYKQLSDPARKRIRQTLKDVDLLIIDEVSMVSNITLMYVNLRLVEIYDTADEEDGWFGGINIVLLGDLLQLPPVNEEFPFIIISPDKFKKHIMALNAFNLWDLFDYDELTINMRQKNDEVYGNILFRVRLGTLTVDNIKVLQTRLIQFQAEDPSKRLDELCLYLTTLPSDSVCPRIISAPS